MPAVTAKQLAAADKQLKGLEERWGDKAVPVVAARAALDAGVAPGSVFAQMYAALSGHKGAEGAEGEVAGAEGPARSTRAAKRARLDPMS